MDIYFESYANKSRLPYNGTGLSSHPRISKHTIPRKCFCHSLDLCNGHCGGRDTNRTRWIMINISNNDNIGDSKMQKIMCIFGTRPEAIKMIPLFLALDKCPQIDASICVTAQHREMLDNVLELFDIKPKYDLNIMSSGQTLYDITTRVLLGLKDVLETEKPDLILVHGDTTTTFAASLAAFYAKIQVGHVEAGLRSFDKYQPYPEEINRKLTTAMSDLHFAPTEDARDKLLNEGVQSSSIYVTGNTAIDMLKYTIKTQYKFNNDILNSLDFSKKIILMTAHRRENLGEPMESICKAVAKLVNDFPDVMLVWAVHPNPAVREVAHKNLAGHERIVLTEPLSVWDLHNLMERSYIILTDSGGLQEEAPSLNKPVVVLRDVTERPEGLKAGTLILAGTDKDKICSIVSNLLTNEQAYMRMSDKCNPFGDGNASQRIVEAILQTRQ